jgi:hypothetical protein
MTDEFIHKTTLDYLVNKDYIAKMNSMTENQNQELKIKKDKRFYRKRVFNLTKELLSGEEPQDIFPDIKQAFDNYMRHCISYFKAIDCSDIMQEEYNESDLLPDELLPDDKLPLKNNMNKLIMRSKPNNLDNFIMRVVKNEPKIVIPQQKVMNLRDPSLKIKGVLEKKKKNLTNKYEETKKDAETYETNNEKNKNFEEEKYEGWKKKECF